MSDVCQRTDGSDGRGGAGEGGVAIERLLTPACRESLSTQVSPVIGDVGLVYLLGKACLDMVLIVLKTPLRVMRPMSVRSRQGR